MLKHTPERFKVFRPRMRKLFLKHFDAYVKTLKAYTWKDGTSAQAPIFSFQTKFRSVEVLTELQELRQKLLKEEEEDSAEAAEKDSRAEAHVESTAAVATP